MSTIIQGGIILTVLAFVASCTSSRSNVGAGCIPPPGSCDLGPPKMQPVDVRGCLGAPTTLTQVCGTSVDRCYPSAGLGVVCAFAPDGGVYVTVASDNDVLTGAGWRFSQYVAPATVPNDQIATASEANECFQLGCASPCPGVGPGAFLPFGPGCSADAGDASTPEAPDGSSGGE